MKCYWENCEKTAIGICQDCYGAICKEHKNPKYSEFYCKTHNPTTLEDKMNIREQKKSGET